MEKKSEIEVLSVDLHDNQSRKLGFSVWEIGPDGKMPDGSHIDDHYQPEKCFATDLADQYKVYHHKQYQKPEPHGWICIPVLEQLKGRPWDNMALNMVHALRPSCIRVSRGCVTADYCSWRVTVYLEQDERTIKRIEQEVEIGTYGIRNGSDMYAYLQGREIPKHQAIGYFNPRGITKLQLFKEEK